MPQRQEKGDSRVGLVRWMALLVVLLGVVSLVLGVALMGSAGSAKGQLAEDLKPLLTLDQVQARYDSVKPKQIAIAQAEEPNIQAGKAAPSTLYTYLTVSRAGLGLTRASLGLISLVRITGIMSLVSGIALVLAGLGLYKVGRKS